MFSKYDVYTTVQSMYCYPDTDVLINKLNIHDKAELKQAEEEFTAVKQMALLQEPIKGRFTKTHLFRIHRFLFEDVYPFAGHIRKEQISKGDTMFYPPDLIDRELERVFKTIHSKKLLAEQDKEKQIQNLSQTMAELNIIHPFREGNGRTQKLTFSLEPIEGNYPPFSVFRRVAVAIAEKQGIPLDETRWRLLRYWTMLNGMFAMWISSNVELPENWKTCLKNEF